MDVSLSSCVSRRDINRADTSRQEAVTGFISWSSPSPAKRNCSSVKDCDWNNNWAWRYTLFTGGALVFVMSVLRVAVLRLRETPKYLLSRGEDAKVVDTFQKLATKYNRPGSSTLEQLEACGTVRSAHGKKKGFSLTETCLHFHGLFPTKKMGRTTIMVWFSWMLIGLAYPLFHVCLPEAPCPVPV